MAASAKCPECDTWGTSGKLIYGIGGEIKLECPAPREVCRVSSFEPYRSNVE